MRKLRSMAVNYTFFCTVYSASKKQFDVVKKIVILLTSAIITRNIRFPLCKQNRRRRRTFWQEKQIVQKQQPALMLYQRCTAAALLLRNHFLLALPLAAFKMQLITVSLRRFAQTTRKFRKMMSYLLLGETFSLFLCLQILLRKFPYPRAVWRIELGSLFYLHLRFRKQIMRFNPLHIKDFSYTISRKWS